MSYCDKCIETCEKINKVTFQEKSVPHGEYEIKIEGKKIKIIPLWKWLLE